MELCYRLPITIILPADFMKKQLMNLIFYTITDIGVDDNSSGL